MPRIYLSAFIFSLALIGVFVGYAVSMPIAYVSVIPVLAATCIAAVIASAPKAGAKK